MKQAKLSLFMMLRNSKDLTEKSISDKNLEARTYGITINRKYEDWQVWCVSFLIRKQDQEP